MVDRLNRIDGEIEFSAAPILRIGTDVVIFPATGEPCGMTTVPDTVTASATNKPTDSPTCAVPDEIALSSFTSTHDPSGRSITIARDSPGLA